MIERICEPERQIMVPLRIDLDHDLQQRLTQSWACVTAENAVLGRVFDACVTSLDEPFKAACREAWESEAVTQPAQMSLNGFGMGDQTNVITSMQCALAYRFGWRRAIPSPRLAVILANKGCLRGR